MGVASLVLGIIAVVMSLIGFQWIASIVGIIGIVLGVLGRKDPEKRGIATAGLVLSIIGTVLGLLFAVACVACIGALA